MGHSTADSQLAQTVTARKYKSEQVQKCTRKKMNTYKSAQVEKLTSRKVNKYTSEQVQKYKGAQVQHYSFSCVCVPPYLIFLACTTCVICGEKYMSCGEMPNF